LFFPLQKTKLRGKQFQTFFAESVENRVLLGWAMAGAFVASGGAAWGRVFDEQFVFPFIFPLSQKFPRFVF
jgi:hypothetical protein